MEKDEEKIETTAPAVEPAKETAPVVEAPKPEVAPSTQSSLNGPFPAELNKWNWGAFLLTWIWAIGNSTWIGLLALISPISLIMAIILGIKGNEWAWQHRKFENVDQFKKVQKAWSLWGLVLFLVSFVLMIVIMSTSVMSGLKTAREKADQAAVNSNSFVQDQLNEISANTNSSEQ